MLCFPYFTDNSNGCHLMFKIYFRTVVIYIKEPVFLIFESHGYGSNNRFFDFLRATDMDPRTGGFYVI